jgi:DNA-binding transcriptional LysR family regulator
MELHQIRYFLAVCETLNFTRAADKCHVTQPALSRAIQKLEEEMGGQLLRRERSLTHLTELGRLLKPHLEQVLEEAETAKSRAKGFLKLTDAPLKLGIMCTIGPLRCIGFLTEFRNKHPGIAITLKEAVPMALRQMLIEGEIDVALLAQEQPFDDRFEAVPLYDERFMVAMPAGHRLANQAEVRMPELSGEPYLSRVNCEFWDYLAKLSYDQGAKNFKTVYQSEREDWIQTMVAAGLGVSFTPEFTTIVGGVVMRPIVDPEVVRSISLVYIAGRRFTPAVATFVKSVKSFKWPSAA